MRSHLYTRSTFVLLLCLLSAFSCSSPKNQGISESEPEVSGTSATAVPTNETLKEKSVPTLGDVNTQLQFKADDALAILEGKPRPTYPETLAVLAGNPPQGTDVCNLSYSALIKAMYDSCFPEEITYIAMSNIIGWAGEENSQSGDTVVYSWGGEQGNLTATFTNGRLTAKSQRDLK
jgi:hypothetical protein